MTTSRTTRPVVRRRYREAFGRLRKESCPRLFFHTASIALIASQCACPTDAFAPWSRSREPQTARLSPAAAFPIQTTLSSPMARSAMPDHGQWPGLINTARYLVRKRVKFQRVHGAMLPPFAKRTGEAHGQQHPKELSLSRFVDMTRSVVASIGTS
jgi:hypothetical protein